MMPERCSGCGMPCMEKIDFLSGLTNSAREMLFSDSQLKTFAAGSVIFRESDAVQALYLIHSGTVKLARWDSDGREQIVGLFSQNDVIWESLFLEDGRYSYTAVCVNEVTLCQISREAVRTAVSQPEIAYRVIDLLSRKLHDANERSQFLASADPERRLAGFLLYRTRHGNTDTVSLRLEEIAGSISLRPETVSRKIKSLEQQKLVMKVGQSRIRILNREALKKIYLGDTV